MLPRQARGTKKKQLTKSTPQFSLSVCRCNGLWTEACIPVEYGEVDEDDDAEGDPERPGGRVDDVAGLGGERAWRPVVHLGRLLPHVGPVVPADQRGQADLEEAVE